MTVHEEREDATANDSAKHDTSVLTDAQRQCYDLIAALQDRIEALKSGEASLGKGEIEGMDEWVSWLRPDELAMLRGYIVIGTFIHLELKISYGMKGRKRKGEAERRKLANIIANEVKGDIDLILFGSNIDHLLCRIARMRKMRAAS